ncbi:MAG: NFACT RNA binding domain-containing protein [Longimicrobiales bacterium]|nr:NFACT RNA binding domain-containing protein [Longimicrobiales bacterium]
MTLRWDPLLVRELARELDAGLAGAHLRAIRLDGEARRMTLLFREGTLDWSLHPSRGAPLLLPPTEPGPSDLPLPARVRGVRAGEDERILVLELLPGRGRGARDVVVELLGNQWNALVVERTSGTIRHVLVRRDAPRPARVGSSYTPPTPSPREGALAPIPLARWRELLEEVPPPQRPKALVASVAWTSPLNARAFVDGDPDPAAALEQGHALWTRLAFGNEPSAPVLVAAERGRHPYPWPLPGSRTEPVPSLLEAFRILAEEDAGDGTSPVSPLLPPELVTALEASLHTQQRRATRLQAELDALEDEGTLRARGDLLLARFREVPAGATRVILAGFDGAEVTLEIDPALPVQENARALYDRATRAGRARARLPGLLRSVGERAAALDALFSRARAGEATADEVRRALPARRSGPATEGGPALPYRTFRSSGGLEIRVGRGARFNDDLTFRHSAPDDVWLHARHAAGAHVILRWTKPGNPPARDLEEAAGLAALHSRARTSAVVPVDWTLRKHVRKPRGAPPGTVAPDRVKTVMVRPDAGLLVKLAVE